MYIIYYEAKYEFYGVPYIAIQIPFTSHVPGFKRSFFIILFPAYIRMFASEKTYALHTFSKKKRDTVRKI